MTDPSWNGPCSDCGRLHLPAKACDPRDVAAHVAERARVTAGFVAADPAADELAADPAADDRMRHGLMMQLARVVRRRGGAVELYAHGAVVARFELRPPRRTGPQVCQICDAPIERDPESLHGWRHVASGARVADPDEGAMRFQVLPMADWTFPDLRDACKYLTPSTVTEPLSGESAVLFGYAAELAACGITQAGGVTILVRVFPVTSPIRLDWLGRERLLLSDYERYHLPAGLVRDLTRAHELLCLFRDRHITK